MRIWVFVCAAAHAVGALCCLEHAHSGNAKVSMCCWASHSKPQAICFVNKQPVCKKSNQVFSGTRNQYERSDPASSAAMPPRKQMQLPQPSRSILFNTIRHYSTLLDSIDHYSTLFETIRYIQHYYTLFNTIRYHSTLRVYMEPGFVHLFLGYLSWFICFGRWCCLFL